MGERFQRPLDRGSLSSGFCLTHTDVEVCVKGEILEGGEKEGRQPERGVYVAHAKATLGAEPGVGGGARPRTADRPEGTAGGEGKGLEAEPVSRRAKSPDGYLLYESPSTAKPFARAGEKLGVAGWPASVGTAEQGNPGCEGRWAPLAGEEVLFMGAPP